MAKSADERVEAAELLLGRSIGTRLGSLPVVLREVVREGGRFDELLGAVAPVAECDHDTYASSSPRIE